MIFNLSGGGGTALNFRVVGGISTPSDPKENTIWVNTSTTITDWVFSATQPEAATGRVWFLTGASGTVEFNALKKNGIQVYPSSAKQYVNGAWVDKPTESYQGGAWVEWISIPAGALFWHGDQCTDVTGGWGVNKSDTSSKNAPTCVFESDRIHLTNNGFASSGVLSTANKIDLTNVNVLSADITKLGSCEPIFYVGGSRTNWGTDKVANATCSATGIIELDVSSVTGRHYVGFYIYADASTLDFSVNEVYCK